MPDTRVSQHFGSPARAPCRTANADENEPLSRPAIWPMWTPPVTVPTQLEIAGCNAFLIRPPGPSWISVPSPGATLRTRPSILSSAQFSTSCSLSPAQSTASPKMLADARRLGFGASPAGGSLARAEGAPATRGRSLPARCVRVAAVREMPEIPSSALPGAPRSCGSPPRASIARSSPTCVSMARASCSAGSDGDDSSTPPPAGCGSRPWSCRTTWVSSCSSNRSPVSLPGAN